MRAAIRASTSAGLVWDWFFLLMKTLFLSVPRVEPCVSTRYAGPVVATPERALHPRESLTTGPGDSRPSTVVGSRASCSHSSVGGRLRFLPGLFQIFRDRASLLMRVHIVKAEIAFMGPCDFQILRLRRWLRDHSEHPTSSTWPSEPLWCTGIRDSPKVRISKE